MKRYILYGLAVAWFVSGCANHHYYRIEGNWLSIYLKSDADTVYFASSLDDYKPHAAQKVGARTWQILVPTRLEFTYFYIVDNRVLLPPCRLKERDDFGSENCVYSPEP